MDDLTLSGVALAALVVLLLLRVPVGVALGGVSLLGIWKIVGAKSAWGILAAVPYDFVASWNL
ncbi:MAG: TRAP transporter large permease, partial [Hyphomicrobiaceae bacterium]